jgi:gliding motility-associated-like protein
MQYLPYGKGLRILLYVASFLLMNSASSQQITFETIEQGPYGNNSSIAVLFKPTGVFPTNNVFELYLSDPTGTTFSAASIGTYASHYTTFINGIIPNTATASTNYKLKIIAKSGTTVVTEQVSHYTISITNAQGQGGSFFDVPQWSKFPPGSNPELWSWGACMGNAVDVSIRNRLNKPLSITVKNEFDYTTAFASDVPRTFTVNSNTNYSLSPIKSVHYRMVAKVTEGSGVISTQAGFLINNKTVGPFSAVLTTVCFSPTEPGEFQFKVDIDKAIIGSQSAYYNFPGYLYEADWKDGRKDNVTIAYLESTGGLITHQYSISSCGQTITANGKTYYNSLGPTLKVVNYNPPCSETVSSITPIQIFQKPVINFTAPASACQNALVTFTNTSNLGLQGSSSTLGCTPPNITYEWQVDGVTVSTATTYSTSTLTPGNHTITLNPIYSINNVSCVPAPVTKTICIQPTLVADFTMDGKEAIASCAPASFTVNNLTNTSICGVTNYQWQVTNATTGVVVSPTSGVFTVTPSLTATAPSFTFHTTGTYDLTLTATNSCGTSIKKKTVHTLGVTGVSFPGPKTYCGLRTIDFTDVNHKPNYNSPGGANEQYQWSVSGGSFNYTGGTTANSPYPQIQFTAYGSYTVSVFFKNNCGENTATQTINFNPPVTLTVPPDVVTCPGTSIGPLQFSSSDGSATFSWTNSLPGIGLPASGTGPIQAFTATNTGTTPLIATISVTALSAIGCTITTPFKITVNTRPALPTATTPISYCQGATATALSATALAGHSLNWYTAASGGSPSSTPPVPSTASAGTTSYFVSQTNTATVCEGPRKQVDVVVNPLPAITGVPNDPTSCSSSTGRITLSGLTTGVTYTVRYSKNGGALSTVTLIAQSGSVIITGLTAGTYNNITVTSPQGCASNVVGPYVLTDPNPPAAPVPSSNGPICSGSNLLLSANTIAGATYAWTGPNGFTSTVQNPTINSASIAASGTYYVTVRVANCTSTPASVSVVINPSPSITSVSSNAPLCAGGNLTLTAVLASNAGATYSWTGPNGFTSDQLIASIPSVTAAHAGTYTFTATVGGCSVSRTTNVTINTSATISGLSTNPTSCGSSTGSITITGLTSNLSYTVRFTLNGIVTTRTLTATNGSVILTNLAAGTYNNISATPSTGCGSNVIGPFTLSDPNPPTTPVIASNNSPICSGATLTLTASGAPAGATYSWTTPSGTTATGSTYSLSNAPVTASGVYSVRAIVNGCSSPSATTTVTVNPTPAQPTASSNGPLCVGATLNLTSNSTTPGVSYSWTGPNGFTSTLQNPSIPNISATASGTYSVVAIGTQGGCSSTPRTVAVTINPLPNITVNAVQPTSCASSNGSLIISGLTSSSAYTVQYTKDGVPVTPFSRTPSGGMITITGLSAGTYSNIVVMLNGCTSAPAGPLTLTVPNPPDAPVIASNNSPICSGATLTLTASGAPTGATYSWTTPSGTTLTGPTVTITNAQTAASGTYSVKSIQNGCSSASATTSVTVNPTPVQPIITNNSPLCAGGTLNLSASSSTSGVAYSWTGPNGFTSTLPNPSLSNITTAASGTYNVIANLGTCFSNRTTNVIVNPVPVIGSSNATDPSSCSAANGTIILNGLTPNTNYTVQYSKNGATPTVLTLTAGANGIVTIPNLGAGTYTNVTVSVSGCTSAPAGPFSLVETGAPSRPVASSNGPFCSGGTLNLSAVSSTSGPVTYQWTGPNGFTSNLQNPIIPNTTVAASGTYYVTIRLNGCSSPAGVVDVLVYPNPDAPIVNPVSYCIGDAPSALSATATTGMSLNWYDNLLGGTPTFNAPIPTTSMAGSLIYYVSQTSSSGCEGPRAALPVNVHALPVISGSSFNDLPNCSSTGGSITLNGLIPHTSYTVHYSKNGSGQTARLSADASGNLTIPSLSAGTYSNLSVSLGNCPSNIVGPFTFTESSAAPATPVAKANNLVCTGSALNLSAESTTQGVKYHWKGPNAFVSSEQNPVILKTSIASAGKYYVWVQLNACESLEDSVEVAVNTLPELPTIPATPIYCQGAKAAALSVSTAPGITALWYTQPTEGTGSTLAPTPSTNQAGTINYYVSQGNGAGCESNRSVVSVFVQPKPSASILTNGIKCQNDEITISSSVASVDPLSPMQWKLSNGITATGSTIYPKFKVPGTYGIQLIATTDKGCTDTAFQTVQIEPAPVLLASQDISLCRGYSVQLNVQGAATYQWTPMNNLSCSTCPNPVSSPTVTTTFVVEGKSTGGCRAYDTIVVNVIQPFKMTVSKDDSICIGSSSALLASGAPQYQWSPTQGLNNTTVSNPVATPTVTTRYTVVGSDRFNCFTDTASVIVAVGQKPIVNLGPDLTLPTGTQYPLHSEVQNGPIRKWQWSPTTNLNCSTCPQPVAAIKKDISYAVQVTNSYGCVASDTVSIKVFCDRSQLFVPNAFTPDNDGANDILMVRGSGIVTIKSFRIFNRWGELIFERNNFPPNDAKYGWDGKVRGVIGGPDVYVFTAEVLCENGTPFTYKGNISLIK